MADDKKHLLVDDMLSEGKRRNPCGVYHQITCGEDPKKSGIPPYPIVLSCMRPMGHEGDHCALIPSGWATWEGPA